MNPIRLNLLSYFLLPGSMLIWLSWVCADDWNHNPNYSSGWLILLFCLYFFYLRAKRIKLPASPQKPLSLWWMAPFPPLILFIELVRLTPIFWRTIPWLIFLLTTLVVLYSACQALGRHAGWQLVWFPLAMLSLSIPWPTFIEINITRQLAFIISHIIGEGLLLSGIYCEVHGVIIQFGNGSVGVDEACSGLRSLQASLMIAFAVGEWFRFRLSQRAILVMLSLAAAFFVNLFRVLLLSLLVLYTGQKGLDAWHDTAGISAMLLLVLSIVFASKFLDRPPPPASTTPPRLDLLPLRPHWLGVSALCLTAFLLAHSWYFFHATRASQEQPFLKSSVWNPSIRQLPLAPSIQEILRADSGGYLIPEKGSLPDVLAYHFFWKPNRSNGKVFFHRPDICMPGGGWSQDGNAHLLYGKLNHRPVRIHRFRFHRGLQTTYLFWMCWVDNEPVAFSGNAYSSLQWSFIPEFLRIGKRLFSVEIFAIVSPVEPLTDEDWKQLMKTFGDLNLTNLRQP